MRYLASKSGVTLKTGLGFVQGHWKRNHLIDRIRVPIGRDLFVENLEIFIPNLYLAPHSGRPRRNFVKMFDAGKTRIIGLPYGEKTMTIC